MIKFIKKVLLKFQDIINLEFIKFFIVGGISTLIDWLFFFLIGIYLNIHYQISLIISYTLGGITNYSLNRYYTFQNKSKKIALQFLTFFSLALVSLFLSMLVMFIFVDILNLHRMLSRILTTAIIFIFNYLMHKFITFNKNLFK